ncbi:MAG: hypothetical protein KA419_06740 [Acidobacteria bacterium]|nr:hypothetical protein [Acidobacteriota bacterium]
MRKVFFFCLVALSACLPASAQDSVARELEDLRKENALLRERVRKLEESQKASDELRHRLEAIEALLASQGKTALPPPEPVAPVPVAAALPVPPAPEAEIPKKPPIKVYGNIELDLTHDSNASAVGGSLDTYGNTTFDLSPRPSRVGVLFNGPRVGGWEVSGKVETDFNTNGASVTSPYIRLRHGFFTAKSDKWKASFLFGQTDDIVGGITQVDSISFPTEAFTGDIGNRRPQIRAEKWFKLGSTLVLRLQGALAQTTNTVEPLFSNQIPMGGDPIDVHVPTVLWRAALEFPCFSGQKTTFLAAYGNWGRKSTRTSPEKNIKVTTWSIGGEAQVWIRPSLLFMGEAWTGEVMDLYRLNSFMLDNFGAPLRNTTESIGGWGSLTWWLRPNIRANLGGGFDFPVLGDGSENTSYTWFWNVFYDFDAHWEVGVEYSRWYNAFPGPDEIRTKNRYQATFLYRF